MNDARTARDDFAQQVFFAAEVIIRERQVHAGDFGNRAQRYAVETAFAEATFRGIENGEPRCVAAPGGTASVARHRRARRSWRRRVAAGWLTGRCVFRLHDRAELRCGETRLSGRPRKLDSTGISTFNEI